jgi:preprotein translocase subunit SecA
MKVQGGEIVQKIMDFANIPEDTPIESGMVSNAIERAQKKMEGMYFDSRKRVVEYDDVVNQQRQIYYTRRFRYLELADKFADIQSELAEAEEPSKELEEKHDKLKAELFDEFKQIINTLSAEYANLVSGEYVATEEDDDSYAKVVDNILGLGNDQFLMDGINEMKLIKKEVETLKDLRKVLRNKLAELDENYDELQEFLQNFLKTVINLRIQRIEDHNKLIKTIFLRTMDELWTHHLDFMQDLREGIGLRGVARLDPLVEYKNEGFKVFSNLIEKINREALQGLLQVIDLTGSNIDLHSQATGVFTNANQISDVLEGDREMLDKFLDNNLKNNKGNNEPKKKLPRRLRRKLEREKNKS